MQKVRSYGSFLYYFQHALSSYLPTQNPKLVKECLLRSVLLGRKLFIHVYRLQAELQCIFERSIVRLILLHIAYKDNIFFFFFFFFFFFYLPASAEG